VESMRFTCTVGSKLPVLLPTLFHEMPFFFKKNVFQRSSVFFSVKAKLALHHIISYNAVAAVVAFLD